MNMVCPNCGNVSDGQRFCIQCGAKLALPLAPTEPASGGAKSPATVSPLSITHSALIYRMQKYGLQQPEL
jgi:hypothetical protein